MQTGQAISDINRRQRYEDPVDLIEPEVSRKSRGRARWVGCKRALDATRSSAASYMVGANPGPMNAKIEEGTDK